ncbi:hypothetical protein [Ectothiorhodospira shaposhnikovii]|uniref:hypothetical protein n=1 Tax=Ectothiorhodospira shaposhnikovii TaxID=1054 RepID=UPI00190578AD|nr:hypothetical protein [Ectothiorhodospira shaposhnikovii]
MNAKVEINQIFRLPHLQKNLSRHGLSANPLIRERYDVIRLQIARVLREIRQLRTQDPETVTRLSLDAIKLSVQKSGRSFTADLNELIRGRRLSSSIATSMMNDENYAFEICSNLIEASHALLLPPTRAEQSAEGQLALNEQDIARMAGGNTNPRTRTHTDENEKTAG